MKFWENFLDIHADLCVLLWNLLCIFCLQFHGECLVGFQNTWMFSDEMCQSHQLVQSLIDCWWLNEWCSGRIYEKLMLIFDFFSAISCVFSVCNLVVGVLGWLAKWNVLWEMTTLLRSCGGEEWINVSFHVKFCPIIISGMWMPVLKVLVLFASGQLCRCTLSPVISSKIHTK
jgi:hypothetical protein